MAQLAGGQFVRVHFFLASLPFAAGRLHAFDDQLPLLGACWSRFAAAGNRRGGSADLLVEITAGAGVEAFSIVPWLCCRRCRASTRRRSASASSWRRWLTSVSSCPCLYAKRAQAAPRPWPAADSGDDTHAAADAGGVRTRAASARPLPAGSQFLHLPFGLFRLNAVASCQVVCSVAMSLSMTPSSRRLRVTSSCRPSRRCRCWPMANADRPPARSPRRALPALKSAGCRFRRVCRGDRTTPAPVSAMRLIDGDHLQTQFTQLALAHEMMPASAWCVPTVSVLLGSSISPWSVDEAVAEEAAR